MKADSLFKGKHTKKALFVFVPIILCIIVVCILLVSLNDRSTQTEKVADGENTGIMSSERGNEEDMDKLYNRINFENAPSTKTPLNEENLNKMDSAINDLDNRVIETHDEYSGIFNEITEVSYSKNIFNPTEFTDGYYNSSGNISANGSYACVNDYWEIEPNTNYCVSMFNPDTSYRGATYCFICFYDENKNFISWIEQATKYFTTPGNAKYMRYSGGKTHFDGTYLIQIEKGVEPTSYVPYQKNVAVAYTEEMKAKTLEVVKTNGLKTVEVTVDVNGAGDYTSLRKAVDFVANSDYEASVIYIKKGTYDIGSYYTASEMSASGFVGLKLPINCSLIGLGDREETILTLTLAEKNERISTLNLTSNNTLKNLRIEGTRTRYAVHDDFGYNFVNDNRIVDNCHIVGIDCYYANAYGAGNTCNGANWQFSNTIFEGDKAPFSVHQGTGEATANNFILFENCRFYSSLAESETKYVCMLRSLSGRIGEYITNVVFKGCKGNGKIILCEENASVYGAGLRYRLTGYANNFNGMLYQTSDGVDYSGYVDLME